MTRQLSNVEVAHLIGGVHHGPALNPGAATISTDSRGQAADLFIAIRGVAFDSHQVISEAITAGCRGVVAEQPPEGESQLPWFEVDNSRRALALLEHAICDNPADGMRVIGVTGTNGKSTAVSMLASIFEAQGMHCGYSTTVGDNFSSSEGRSVGTTPAASILARGLARWRRRGVESAVIEVSSHGLDQHRVDGIPFSGALLTTFGRDHLDYHGDESRYLRSKLRLLELLADGAPAVLPATLELPAGIETGRLSLLRFGIDDDRADAGGELLESGFEGSQVRIDLPAGEEITLGLKQAGRHNLSNALGVALLAHSLGVPTGAIATGLENAPSIPGRLEEVPVPRGRVFIDFAHTPDALEALLTSVKPWMTDGGRLHLLFGCGGGRDRGKRPLMGKVASRLADRLILTSDNARTEDPEAIISEINAGVLQGVECVENVDRRLAIGEALGALGEKDVLLIAGKGHELTQEIGSESLPFDEREVVVEFVGGERV